MRLAWAVATAPFMILLRSGQLTLATALEQIEQGLGWMTTRLIHIYEMLEHSPDRAYIDRDKYDAFMIDPNRKEGLVIVAGDFREMNPQQIFEYIAKAVAEGRSHYIAVDDMM